MIRISPLWLSDPASKTVMRALTSRGHEAYFVGGCVRDAFVGREAADIDISTNADPQTVTNLAKSDGLRVIPTGIEHGTVTVVCNDIPFEVTTYRRDVETDGRRAVVAYAQRLEEDAHRRDFTMNALYADAEGLIRDPLGGVEDLQARRVRFIDDPHERIREDFLRILRFFRFHAWYGDPDEGLDADGLAACAAHIDGLGQLSRERVGAEMTKLLRAPDPAPALAAMQHSGVLAASLTGADARQIALLVHLERQCDAPPDAMRRLAVLGGENPGDALRLSRADQRHIQALLSEIGEMHSVSALGYRLGFAVGRDAILAKSALLETDLPENLISELRRGEDQTFPLTAKDLMPEYEGPALGAALREKEERWIASGFSLTRTQLLE